MRRILASLLLAAISFTLAPAALFASADSDLPACCRKDGKHKCGMGAMEADGPTVRGVSQCPMFPAHASSATASSAVGASVPQHRSEVHVGSFLNSAEQVDAQYRISFSRSRQKRGPPHSSSI